jgi:hypothetical protein
MNQKSKGEFAMNDTCETCVFFEVQEGVPLCGNKELSQEFGGLKYPFNPPAGEDGSEFGCSKHTQEE